MPPERIPPGSFSLLAPPFLYARLALARIYRVVRALWGEFIAAAGEEVYYTAVAGEPRGIFLHGFFIKFWIIGDILFYALLNFFYFSLWIVMGLYISVSMDLL